MRSLVVACVLFLLMLGLWMVSHAAPVDPRFCGDPARNADGSIKRSTAAKRAFIAMHPCPASGATGTACPGWSVDHVVPLACGGCDSPVNMQWLPLTIKACAGAQCKDRWERTVYETGVPCH